MTDEKPIKCECGTDLRQGDCLELMKDIPDGSVDWVLKRIKEAEVKNC